MRQVENNISLYSSKTERLRTLARTVGSVQAEKFLKELLNLNLDDRKARLRFWRQCKDLLPRLFYGFALTRRARNKAKTPDAPLYRFYDAITQRTGPPEVIRKLPTAGLPPLPFGEDENFEAECTTELRSLTATLREAWNLATPFEKEWALLLAAAKYLSRTSFNFFGQYLGDSKDRGLYAEWLGSDPCIAVILRAMSLATRLRFCPNASCPAPYFVARRRSQKYCSDACALPSQREFKRRWWAEHGEARRKAPSKRSRRERGK